jgi:uncharacterized integral membrane protein
MNTAPSRADPAIPSGPPGPAPTPAARRRFAPRRRSPVRRTRTGGWWVALIAAAVMLLLLLIFVLQNGDNVRVSFLGAHGNLPLGIALLLAATAGVLIVAIPGTGRIIQLRHLARRQTQSNRPDPPTPVSAAPAPAETGTRPLAAPSSANNAHNHADGPATPPETSGERPPGQPAG